MAIATAMLDPDVMARSIISGCFSSVAKTMPAPVKIPDVSGPKLVMWGKAGWRGVTGIADPDSAMRVQTRPVDRRDRHMPCALQQPCVSGRQWCMLSVCVCARVCVCVCVRVPAGMSLTASERDREL